MHDEETMQRLAQARAGWEEHTNNASERKSSFTTGSGRPIRRLYGPTDLPELDYQRDLGGPGEFPFTRGIHATGHRGRLWTFRMFSGFGSAEETNRRYRYLLEEGETGLSVAFDMPTLMGLDADDPAAAGEFGRCGVCVSSLADMEILFQGIPLDQVTTSMTINSPAAVIWAMYIATAERQGVPRGKLGGTIQNDILKEYISQNEFIYPPEPSMRLVTDTIEFGTHELPLWNTISISGYHIREAGATAAQELAFTLADGLTYVEHALARGLDVDRFAPRLSFFFNCHNDFFEEIAKFRAARRIWARLMRDRYGARNPRSWWMRFHTQTAGCSLYPQQPEVNLIRVALQALAGVLGGTQSLHTNAMDEALALPSAKAALLALRTQQVIAHESGVTDTVDPLGGSYFVEHLTNEMERDVHDYLNRIEALGGVIPAIQVGFFQREIADASYRYQREVESRERIIVGMNEYVDQRPPDIPILEMDPEGEKRHRARLQRLRAERDGARAAEALAALERASAGSENLMPYILDAVNAYCTLGEICGVMRKVFGEYREHLAV